MIQNKLFTKLLLVAAMLGVGSMSAWADETRSLIYSNDFETSSDWTANGKTDGWRVNPGNTTANTFDSKVIGNGAGNGDMGLCSPSFSISSDVKIVDVELKFKMDACTNGKSSGIDFVQPTGVTIGSGYISDGTPFFSISASASGNGYWGTITVGGTNYLTELNQTGTFENNILNRNTTGIVVLNARFNFTTKETTFTLKKTDETVLVASTTVAFADATATSLDKIFLHAGKSYGGVTIDDVSVYSVTSSTTYADYTVHFLDNNGDPVKADVVRSGEVGKTVNANSADFDDYFSADNKYVYSSDGGGVVVANDGSSELTVTYTKYAKYNYTVNAIDNSDNILAELASGYVYADDNSVTTSLPWYILYGGTLYYQNQNSNTTAITSSGQVVSITYAATETTNVVSYTEGENISGGTKITHASSSNGASARALSSAKFATLDAGKYKVVARFVVGNGTDGNTYATNPITVGEKVLEYNVPAKKNTTYTSEEFIVTGSTDLYVTFAGSSISGVDYIYVQRTGDAVETVEVSAAGMATYVSEYNLDFSSTTLKAYKVQVTAKATATLTKLDEVPAGTPVLLIGATEDVPVMTSAAAVTDNDLVAGTGAAVATTDGEYKNMILNQIAGNTGFYFANDQIVAANRAYLHFSTTLAPDPSSSAPMMMIFADDMQTTGVNSLTPNPSPRGEGSIYNLNGQRVANPTKGLYIVNGKKFVIK